MNYNGGRVNRGGAPIGGGESIKNFDFDFGLQSRQSSKSLNDQKGQNSAPPPSSPFGYSRSTTPSMASNKTSWTHQVSPAARSAQFGGKDAGLSGPTSMVGDIFGKSWSQPLSSKPGAAGVGITDKNPDLFGDLLGTALGQGKGSNVPLKDSTSKGVFTMANMTGSLPKTGHSGSTGSLSSEMFGGFESNKIGSSSTAASIANSSGDPFASFGASGWQNAGTSSSVPLKNSGSSSSVKAGGDPFGSLADFGFRSSSSQQMNSTRKSSDFSSGFGDFQHFAPTAKQPSPSPLFSSPTQPSDSFGDSYSRESMEKPGGVDPLDSLFSSSSSSLPQGNQSQGSFGIDDWGEFGGSLDSGTTELEGLPPPPAGLNASTGKEKGLDYYKQGQFADAIKWLSWAITLYEKAADDSSNVEVLSCRASCYKEVGEYKKAIADCSKVLEKDGKNVTLLVQRALLYESSEKYKLGAEDLRLVLKIDPGNRVAKGTLHRLVKLAD